MKSMRTHRSSVRVRFVGSAIFAVAALAISTNAQEHRDDPRKSDSIELDKLENLIKVSWRFDPGRGLLLSPNPILGAAAPPGLTPYWARPELADIKQMAWNLGVVGWFVNLFGGDEDLVSRTYADYHFRRTGLERHDGAVRMRIATPEQGDAEAKQLDTLRRILAVRIAQRRGIKKAVPELTTLSADQSANVFLRWAAQDVLASLTGKPVISAADRAARFPSLDETLAAVPDAYDFILTIDQTRLPFFHELSWLWRRLGIEKSAYFMKNAVETVTDSMLAGANILADTQAILVFEIARRMGNQRVSRMTVAALAARGAKTPAVWVRFDGRFQAARIAAAMKAEGLEQVDGAFFVPDIGVHIGLTDRAVTAWTPDYPLNRIGGTAAELKELGFGGEHQLVAALPRAHRTGTASGNRDIVDQALNHDV